MWSCVPGMHRHINNALMLARTPQFGTVIGVTEHQNMEHLVHIWIHKYGPPSEYGSIMAPLWQQIMDIEVQIRIPYGI